ncbi:MAG TPA: DUF1513 domain-containing protein [Cellvibrionaceae bacterium]
MLSRRTWLQTATALGASFSARSHAVGAHTKQTTAQTPNSGWLLSAADGNNAQPHLVAISRTTQSRYAWPLPGRAHDIGLLPARPEYPCLGYCIARRPGTWLYWFDLKQGKLLARIESPTDSHFYGHAATNTDGSLLYVTENHYQTSTRLKPRGVIGIYETKPPFNRVGEFDAQGLGPHQILFDAPHQNLIVANGGNITHPSSEREVLNLATMQPNISYLAAETGKLLELREPTDHQMSLRHIALAENGLLAIGAQDQAGLRDPDEPAPLVFTHKRGQPLSPLPANTNQWLAARQYIGSMAVAPDGSAVLASAPRGNQLLLWQNSGALQVFNAVDAAGIAWNTQAHGFMASNSGGQLFNLSLTPGAQLTALPAAAQWHWDNHLFLG